MRGNEDEGAATGLRVAALGPLTVTWRGDALTLGGAKQQMVLALLLLEANSVVSVDRLLEWVWPDDHGDKRGATLQVYVSNLRRTLGPAAEARGGSVIETRRPGYVIELDDDELDILRFRRAQLEGEVALRDGRPAAAAAAFRSAMSTWRGEPMSGLPIDATDSGGLRRLELMRTSMTEQLAEAELAVGHHRELLDELPTWVAEQPLDERLRGHLMVALYRSGRQADALATFEQGRQLLLDELGISPSRELRDLEHRILNQDPTLDLPRQRPERFTDEMSTALRTSVLSRGAVLEVDGRSVRLDASVLTIGRLPDRDLVLDDPGVSRVHAEIRQVGSTYRIVDVGSANGTVVAGERVIEHVLNDGDVIRVGEVEMVFRRASED